MGLFLVIGLAWLGIAVLGWSWLVAAARADRGRRQPPSRPPRSRPPA